jgi:3-dehydrotetronate 4-kinase
MMGLHRGAGARRQAAAARSHGARYRPDYLPAAGIVLDRDDTMILLGSVADDLTGATDLCNTLVRGGMRTIQVVGVPPDDLAIPEADAVVVSLKSRTIAPETAVAMSLKALAWLRKQGARQILFKYCSTFDSTDRGNIGPVGDALREALGARFTIACPAFPENRRTTYLGHLFVGDVLISDSPMRHHPLTPMTDANLQRVLGRQTKAPIDVVPYSVVRQGADAIRRAFATLADKGFGYAIVDALEDKHLYDIGTACNELALVTGGSGVALGLPENFRRAGLLATHHAVDSLPVCGGASAVLAGSCSQATQTQVACFSRKHPAFFLDPRAVLADANAAVAGAMAWARGLLSQGPVLIYSSEAPEQVQAAQAALGRGATGGSIEQAFAAIATALHQAGVRRLVVAGGETAGAVVQALGVRALRIGPQIAPGVPWTAAIGAEPLALALKSGNFGDAEFFARALEMIA